VSAPIIADSPAPAISAPGLIDRLYDSESYPKWREATGIIGYLRTSPDNNSHTWQWFPQRLADFAASLALPVVGYSIDKHKHGGRFSPTSRPALYELIKQAQATGCPIVAFDWQRFARDEPTWRKLATYGVDFISIEPLWLTEAELNAARRRAANHYRPQGRGGRPPDSEAPYALPLIMSRLGQPWSTIASELGAGWSDNKAKRVFLRHFVYKPLK
jgi:hypothetical protein